MKLLLCVPAPSFGGHTRSAVSLASELRCRGHSVEFLVGAKLAGKETPALIEEAGFHIHALEIRKDGILRRPFEAEVRSLLRACRFEVVHLVGHLRGLPELARACRKEGRSFLWTLPSGGAPKRFEGLNRVAVFTPEVAEEVRRTSPRTVPHILPARIDFRPLDELAVAGNRSEVRRQFGIPEDALLIVRVARAHPLYLKSVRIGIHLAEQLAAEGRPTFFLHAGYPQEQEVAELIRDLVLRANERAGRRIAFTESDDVALGARYMAAADLCIASGRSALEAIGLGRTTLLAWGDGVPGLVDDVSIATHADTNFQGRLEPSPIDEGGCLRQTLAALKARLADPEEDARIREVCARFVRERYSIQGAAVRYEELYWDRTIRVVSPMGAYLSPSRIGRAISERVRRGR